MGRRLERTLVPCPGAVSWRFIGDLWRGAAGTHILGRLFAPTRKRRHVKSSHVKRWGRQRPRS
jgi:hypothetical protein